MILTTTKNKTIRIKESCFGCGEEGNIHEILTPTHKNKCAKIYNSKDRTLDRENKIKYMIYNKPSTISHERFIFCWPEECLYENGDFVGFTMPLADRNSISLYELCRPQINPKLDLIWRTKFDRKHNLRSRVAICTNLSIAIHMLHVVQKYVIVDLKPNNILLTIDKLYIVDCDSMQIMENNKVLYPASAATPEYIPPEGWQDHINGIKKQSFDLFSLSVIFYQILFGLHPMTASFIGKYESVTTVADKIRNGLFVFGTKKDYISVLPEPHNDFHKLPSVFRSFFHRALDKSIRMPDIRPTGEEWGMAFAKALA